MQQNTIEYRTGVKIFESDCDMLYTLLGRQVEGPHEEQMDEICRTRLETISSMYLTNVNSKKGAGHGDSFESKALKVDRESYQ